MSDTIELILVVSKRNFHIRLSDKLVCISVSFHLFRAMDFNFSPFIKPFSALLLYFYFQKKSSFLFPSFFFFSFLFLFYEPLSVASSYFFFTFIHFSSFLFQIFHFFNFNFTRFLFFLNYRNQKCFSSNFQQF